ncbi:PIG-L deacetylase family protein [Oceanirhabdus sp. W0125-5]|uniref:PIG-L deacetylase family protein n=1 Tax=Oceanirhabdus sp. W0125-5 TaxID=2999116 RepID=UPI0022F31011|nr:PIG-L deacetylase family protein [Oceanirhabdus sp. W0125-5]WBW96617.1 PIG-L family deacetylase [Oceanirhabdus sp. W0125-5]
MFKKVLVLAPHTDDGELGCGGTIAKLIEEGSDIYYAVFSVCEISVPNGFPKNILELELKNAARVLGIKENNIYIYKYPVRTFPQNRQHILEELIKLRDIVQPDLVLMPSPNDIHQDHNTIANEGIRAFKETNLLGYEIIWNNLTINTQYFFKLKENHLNKKIQALKCYESQKFRKYFNEKLIRSLATIRGAQIGSEYAELFEVIRVIS